MASTMRTLRGSRLSVLSLLLAVTAVACGETVEIPDISAENGADAAPSADAGRPPADRDAGAADSGGSRDASPSTDASTDARDAGEPLDASTDAGPSDAGSSDASTTTDASDAGSGTTSLRVYAGGYQTCAVRGRAVYCWGSNDFGQLGFGAISADVTTPTKVGDFDVLDMGLGYDGSCVVRAPGNVYCAGRLYGATPRLVASGFSRVSHGRDHACALANDGTVWCWGSNASGKLGRGTFGGPESSIPAQVQGLSGVQVVVAARTHTCALKLDKTVVCWGGNFDGQLGIGLSGGGNDRNVPTAVPGLTDVVTISANAHHTCATKTDKSVWCWGGNASSQLGVGDALDRTVPTRLTGFSAEVAVAGSTFSLTRSGGAIFTFGSNTNSELGRGAVGTSPTPAPIVGLDQVTFADAGYSHACVVRQGAISCWGDNGSGQLGLGDKANRAVPVTVTLP